LSAEIERTQALLEERKRFSLASPKVMRAKGDSKTKRKSDNSAK